MKQYRLLLTGFLAALALSLAGCGGGGGGGGGGGPNNSTGSLQDRDGDGIPDAQDAFPDNLARFANFGMKNLTVPNGAFSAAVDVSDAPNPLIVGSADQGTGVMKAVTWTLNGATGQPASAITLNALAGNTYSSAFGVNDAGTVVGESEKSADFVAVFWPAGGLDPAELSLTVGTTTFAGGAAYGINDAGQIVGEIKRADGTLMAALWTGTAAAPVELPSLGGSSASAYFISDGGWIVGESATAAGVSHATLWTVNAAGVPGSPVDLGVLPGHLKSIALGVDNEGRIVGESEDSGGEVHATLWIPGLVGYAIADLGSGASAQAINDADRIAGHSGATSLARAWDTRNTSLVETILPGVDNSQAFGMNEGNMVVGVAGSQGFLALPQ